jgi:membrane protease YdiL (CAAX protease family)
VIAAFLSEYPFYLAAGFVAARQRLARMHLPLLLAASAAAPYLVCCFGAIEFQWTSLVRLIALGLALGLWYVILPVSAFTDAAFLALIAVVVFGKYFDVIYPSFFKLPLATLGHLALIRMAVMILTMQRRVHETGYGFWPRPKEWKIGAAHFLYFIPIGLPLALSLRAVEFARVRPVYLAAFLGFLWVLALWEEFLFRGVLLQWFEEWTLNGNAALLLTSAIFGLAHLPFHTFPNWRWVLIAAALGWFCGRARNQAGSIKASMVTHALVVTAWRTFFS